MNPEARLITSRAEWLAWRRQCMTASRIGALFDCHPFLSRDDLAAQLRGRSQGDSTAKRAGRILEPGVLVVLREDHPDWVIEPAHTFHVDPALRFGCTPDAWFSEAGRYLWDEMDGVVQVKSVSSEVWDKWHGKPSLAYTLQTLSEMMLAKKRRGLLAIMVRTPSFPVYEFPVPRHPAAEARILAAVAEWWRAWDAGAIADAADPEGLAAALDDGSVRDLSADNAIRGFLEEHEAAKADAAAAETRIKAVECEIKQRIGPARSAWLPGWSLSWPTLHRAEYTVAATDYRRLTIKRVEE